MSAHLLDGVNILNPFIRPQAFLLWSDDLIQEKKKPSADMLTTGDMILYLLQIYLMRLLHVGVVGGLVRAMANNLMKLNIFLATEWKHFIISQEESNKDKINLGLGAAQAFLIIPILVLLSLCNILYRSLLKYRSEIVLIVMLATSIVILTSLF